MRRKQGSFSLAEYFLILLVARWNGDWFGNRAFKTLTRLGKCGAQTTGMAELGPLSNLTMMPRDDWVMNR